MKVQIILRYVAW